MIRTHWRRARRLLGIALHVMIGATLARVLMPAGPQTDFKRARRVVQWWNQRLCRLLGLRVRVHGKIGTAPALIAANHVSWLDVIALAAVCPGHFVAKQEMRGWPLLGWLSERAGTLFIQRGDGATTARLVEQMTWHLVQGKNVVLFPEGTTGTGLTVQHFHPRLFQAAVNARCTVQAVAVRYPHPDGVHPLAPFVGDDDLPSHLWRLVQAPALEVELTFFPPYAVTDTPRRRLAEHARAQIAGLVENQPLQESA